MYIDNEKLIAIEGNQMPNNVFPFSQETKADHQVLGQYQRYYSGQTCLWGFSRCKDAHIQKINLIVDNLVKSMEATHSTDSIDEGSNK